MSAISASMVKDLRERTGAGMMECKKALAAANGDIEKAIEEMPLSLKDLGRLFDHLDFQLGIQGCDHTPRITSSFLVSLNLDTDEILPWLSEQGGSCDCEILANVEDGWESEIAKNT